MEGSIWPRIEIYVNSGLPIAMVPCLHQSNVYIKRKLTVWRAEKCIPLVGAKTALTCMGLQTFAVHGGPYRSENEKLLIAMVPCFQQSNVYIKWKLTVWRAQKRIPLVGAKTVLTCTNLQTTAVHGGQYRAENENLRKFGSTYRHGTVFAPKQCLYQEEANGMESPKLYSNCWCKNCTYLYWPANYRGLWRAV